MHLNNKMGNGNIIIMTDELLQELKGEIVHDLKSSIELLGGKSEPQKTTLNTRDVVNEYGLSDSTQRNYRKQGILPYTKMEGRNGLILYKRDDIEAALENYKVRIAV